MVQVPYQWVDGAVLKEHSKKKHQVLKKYLADYLYIRCRVPQQTRFRLAIVDGFAGGGAYVGGEPGSPLIFLELLLERSKEINIQRAAEGMATINFECLLVFNDSNIAAIKTLEKNIAPLIDECDAASNLTVKVEIMNETFETAYPQIKVHLAQERITRNVFFNLDQCGHSLVPKNIIVDILSIYQSAEILLNLAAQSLLTYLSRNNPESLANTLQAHGVDKQQIEDISTVANKKEWRATIEKAVFESYRSCCPYVSPFAINNPDGWLYWLLHFANEPKARQVYNDLLHENEGLQGHYGRSGLKMLMYDPSNEGQDYLFGTDDRERARKELYEDIPRAISEYGDAVRVSEFIRIVSNETPAHSQDLARSMIDNPDLIVKTEQGGERRSHKGIKPSDTLILKPQRSFILMPTIQKK